MNWMFIVCTSSRFCYATATVLFLYWLFLCPFDYLLFLVDFCCFHLHPRGLLVPTAPEII